MDSVSESQKCPRCGNPASMLLTVDSGMRVALESTGQAAGLPDQVCSSCLTQLSSTSQQGLKVRSEKDNRDKDKMVAWKNRVHLIKNARSLMSQKAYSEAAVQYEKYVRVLEMVYGVKKGELSPKVFNNSTRSKELTVLASVFWDLVRIYDSSPRYGDRMAKSAEKLAEFLQFSQIYPDVLRKAEQFAKTAKNPQVVRNLIRATRGSRGACFIATAAFKDQPDATEVLALRWLRDRYLRPVWAGRQLIWIYYKTSPPVARWINRHPRRMRFARSLITKMTRPLKKSLNLP